ncbi:hypothetical protein M9Y10_006100 [Tritrichomonas musculus]|uniref:Leucine-rich repeat domain-containing protein n=1 Tax=Tritrichomonas musculus TaxID=1915356 RepID=A0ABR2JDA8_9EUKA
MQTHIKSGIYFELDSENFTAKVISSPRVSGAIFIPRSVNHRSQEYLVTTIGEGSFKDNRDITSIDFPDDSELLTIEKEAFFGTLIDTLTIPSKVKELKEGWCSFTSKLTNIKLSQDNPNFTYYNDLMILGKSKDNSETFDLLIFARRDIYRGNIPSTVKRICSYSFNDCYNIKFIEFSKDSQLVSIDKCAFLYSSVESISIPATVEQLNEGWCEGTTKLSKFILSPENQYYSTLNPKIIVKKSDKYGKRFDVIVFACRNIDRVVVPSYITRIASHAFSGCRYMQSIEFPRDSKLTRIDDFAFAFSSIENIIIPTSIKVIGRRAFFGCRQLNNVKFSIEAQVDLIENGAFEETGLKKIAIPQDVKELKEGWCDSNIVTSKIAPDDNFDYFYKH